MATVKVKKIDARYFLKIMDETEDIIDDIYEIEKLLKRNLNGFYETYGNTTIVKNMIKECRQMSNNVTNVRDAYQEAYPKFEEAREDGELRGHRTTRKTSVKSKRK